VGDLDGCPAVSGGPVRREQPGVDELLDELLVVVVPLRAQSWPTEVPQAVCQVVRAGHGGLCGDERDRTGAGETAGAVHTAWLWPPSTQLAGRVNIRRTPLPSPRLPSIAPKR